MNFEKLNQNYYILYSFSYKKDEIFVCRDKQNLDYKYFKFNNNEFCSVKSPALDAFLKPFTDNVLYEEQSDLTETVDFQDALKYAKSKALLAISDLDELTQQHAKSMLNTVKFNIEKMEKNSGLYSPNSHMITIDEGCLKSPLLHHIILHELMHCMSNNNFRTGIQITNIDLLSSGNLNIQYLNSIINEAITEILTQKYDPVDKKYYTLPVNVFSALLKYCDPNEIKRFYFNCDAESFIDYLATNFHQQKSEIIKLSLLFDATELSYKYAIYNDSSYVQSNIAASLSSLYSLTCKMIIDKLKIEKKSVLNSLNFNEVFSIENLPTKIKNTILGIQTKSTTYFEYYKHQESSSNSITSSFDNIMFPVYQKKFFENFIENIELPSEYPEKFKTFEIFQQVLAPSTKTYTDTHQPISKQVLFERLFDKSKNYLPKDKILLSKIVEQYLEIFDQYDFDVSTYMDQNIVVKVISKRGDLFAKFCRINIYFLYNNRKQLPQILLANKHFYRSLLHQLIKEENKSTFEILLNYFYDLDTKFQTKFLNDQNFWMELGKSKLLSKEQLHKKKKEITEFLQENSEKTM